LSKRTKVVVLTIQPPSYPDDIRELRTQLIDSSVCVC
jgi:hypothetical protein